MRWFVLMLMLAISGEIRADEFFLIPENNPKPHYPMALQRAGIIGDVRVGFTVNADGSVSKVKILKSDHPDLAEATRVAITQWRFKSWIVEGGKPAEQKVIAPMVFRFDMEFPVHINQWLKELRCRDLNEALVHAPEHEWADFQAFHFTRAYLSNAFSSSVLTTERRLAMIAKLNRKVPIIVRECMNNPVSRFARYLPADIRKML